MAEKIARKKGAALLLLVSGLILYLTQRPSRPVETEPQPVMGIVSTTAEDDRRETQTQALLQAAEAGGFTVLSMPVERTQQAQIEAIRALLVYRVDAIVFTPIVESGWDNVLREAQAAHIPLIAVDKSIRSPEEPTVAAYVGFDYAALAEQAVQTLLQSPAEQRGILELYGTLNASDAREIARGCREECSKAGRSITYSLCGDGMRSRGYEILEGLEEHLDEIGYIIAHNDAMARGAVDYLREHERVPGVDIQICSIGGGADIRQQVREGSIAVVAALDNQALARLSVQAVKDVLRQDPLPLAGEPSGQGAPDETPPAALLYLAPTEIITKEDISA